MAEPRIFSGFTFKRSEWLDGFTKVSSNALKSNYTLVKDIDLSADGFAISCGGNASDSAKASAVSDLQSELNGIYGEGFDCSSNDRFVCDYYESDSSSAENSCVLALCHGNVKCSIPVTDTPPKQTNRRTKDYL